jgi:hypothetical protein
LAGSTPVFVHLPPQHWNSLNGAQQLPLQHPPLPSDEVTQQTLSPPCEHSAFGSQQGPPAVRTLAATWPGGQQSSGLGKKRSFGQQTQGDSGVSAP